MGVISGANGQGSLQSIIKPTLTLAGATLDSLWIALVENKMEPCGLSLSDFSCAMRSSCRLQICVVEYSYLLEP